MQKILLVLAALMLSVGLAGGCGGSMKNLKDKAATEAKDTGCEAACDEAREECVKGCAGETAEGEAKDNAACELACDEAQKKCVSDCTEK
ncbi:MAG: hypothetical protein V3T05_08690 [Myxococcota bacterium]